MSVTIRAKAGPAPRKLAGAVAVALAVLLAALPRTHDARAEVVLVLGLGDSLGAGVQSADATFRTQPFSYLNLVTRRIGAPSILPWIVGGPFTSVGNTTTRHRLLPNRKPTNLAVSGANVHDLLYTQADALTEAEIDSEEDLIQFPRTGSQVEIAETLTTFLILCWIGNNDALAAVLDFDQLDTWQLTPVAAFEQDFTDIVDRLSALGAPIVFANIPNVTDIAYLMDGDELIELFGTDHGLAAGSRTTVITAYLIALGILSPAVIGDPGYVLDGAEVAAIQARIDDFNQIIADVAGAAGHPVADIHALFADATANPPVVGGVTLTRKFLGGLFSLDGVHPSNIGHALAANEFIETINAHFGASVPTFSAAELDAIALSDPFVDKDGDGVVRGRFLAGAVETIAMLIGVSGDPDDNDPSVFVNAAPLARPTKAEVLAAFRALRPDARGAAAP